MTPVENEDQGFIIVGDEELNEAAVAHIGELLRDDELPIAVSGFDFESKVIAISDQRIIIVDAEIDDSVTLVLDLNHDDIHRVTREGRTLIIGTTSGEEHRHRFGNDQTVEELVETAYSQLTSHVQVDDGEKGSIAEKVRFWEEQDKINQELIPRVLRQNELLTQHIADHENLPEVAGNAVSQALAGAKAEQIQQYEAALDTAREQLNEQTQDSLNQALAIMSEESRKTRNMATAIAAVAAAIAISALVLGILV